MIRKTHPQFRTNKPERSGGSSVIWGGSVVREWVVRGWVVMELEGRGLRIQSK